MRTYMMERRATVSWFIIATDVDWVLAVLSTADLSLCTAKAAAPKRHAHVHCVPCRHVLFHIHVSPL